jgi:hypothetical protein
MYSIDYLESLAESFLEDWTTQFCRYEGKNNHFFDKENFHEYLEDWLLEKLDLDSATDFVVPNWFRGFYFEEINRICHKTFAHFKNS